jgi:hypothetical protein
MPFTFSHAAVVLPFLKNKRVSATGLVIGTFAPDLEFFFRMRMQSEISHKFSGVFLIDLPLSILVVLLFHQIIKKPLLNNLPLFFQQRLETLKQSDWLFYFNKNKTTVFLSFFVGVLTHLTWDSMTHWDGYLVLNSTLLNKKMYDVAYYDVLQYVSSLIGLFFISFYFIRQPEVPVVKSQISSFYWSGVVSISTVCIVLRFILVINRNTVGDILVGVISSVFISMVVMGIVFNSRLKAN